MSGISSSTGIISGLPTADLISQLMAIEARPKQVLQDRISILQAKRAAFSELSARLLSLQNQVQPFSEPSFFKVFSANSSDDSVLSAVADENAAVGSFDFQVHSLVSTHRLFSSGYTDADTTPVGAGSLTLETGRASVSRSTDVEALNGGTGIRRGRIEITDRAGHTAEIDLTAVLTVQDILDEINGEPTINVRARVSGDRIVIDDLNATDTEGSLIVRDVGQGHLAEDLGLATALSATAGDSLTLTGADIIGLADGTLLKTLNDGNGIGKARAGTDFTILRDDGASFDVSLSATVDATTRLEVLNSGNAVRLGVIRITDREGNSADVDLNGATNLGEIVDAIEQQTTDAGLDISVTYFNSSSAHALQLADGSGGEGAFKIEDVSGYAAADLGIAGENEEEESIVGNSIHRIATIGDVLRAVQYAYDATNDEYNDGRVIARISENGNGLQLSGLGFPPGFEVVAAEGSTAAVDLGITGRYDGGVAPAGAGRDLVAGLNTVLLNSLNGGNGVGLGNLTIGGVQIDLTGTAGSAQTLQDVVDRINAASDSTNVTAETNAAGNGIVLRHASGGDFTVADVDGTVAADLNLAGSHAEVADSGNLQLQYVSRQTLLDDLNNGRGVRTGRFKIVDATGAMHSVNITNSQKTVGDVIELINSVGGGAIVASVNASGDGLLITDNSGGTETLQIGDTDGSFTAADLNLVGEAAEGQTTIDGSFEVRVDIDADDTLRDIAEKINEAGGDYSAAVINDGTGTAPYHLSISSTITGSDGQMLFDSGTTRLDMETLVEGRDAVVFFGSDDTDNPIIMRSASNTLDSVLEGVTIDLTGTSDEPVTLTVDQDVEQIVDAIGQFVADYNSVIDSIEQHTSFDSETFERGTLFGESAVTLIENRLFRTVTGKFAGASTDLSRLSSVGVTIQSSSGGRLEFDADEFRNIYAENPEAVEQLFTAEETGIGDTFESMLDDLTRGFDGVLARQNASLEKQEELLTDRIDAIDILLEKKQSRLERQFQNLEMALASLEDQQTALAALSQLASG